MQVDNIQTREFQSKIVPNQDQSNRNIIQFPTISNPHLVMAQEALNLPLCTSVKSCLSSEKINPFDCPHHNACGDCKALLVYFAK